MATQKVLTDDQVKQMEMVTITMSYNELVGQEFTGYCLGLSSFSNKSWDVITPALDDPIRSKLAAIQTVAQGKVWKGFTNSQDSYLLQNWDFRFFVDLDRAGILTPTKFRINNYEKFPIPPTITDYEFGVGISLKVTAIAPPPPFLDFGSLYQ